MGVIKAESEINIAEMSNVSSFLAICLERLRTTTGRTSQTDPIPPNDVAALRASHYTVHKDFEKFCSDTPTPEDHSHYLQSP
jgi:hypothetical protein